MDWDNAAKNLVENLPSDIIDIMSQLGTVWGDKCFLGGGAVRDLLLGKEIKDWDFYFPYCSLKDSKEIMNLVKNVFGDELHVGILLTKLDSEYDDSFLVLNLLSQKTIPNKKLEFIFTGQQIEDFDHAICQCSINCATFQLETTKWFDRCVADKIHRIFTCNLNTRFSTHKSIHDHTKRIQKKYPWPIFLETGIKYNYV
jgi:hypothetical protein